MHLTRIFSNLILNIFYVSWNFLTLYDIKHTKSDAKISPTLNFRHRFAMKEETSHNIFSFSCSCHVVLYIQRKKIYENSLYVEHGNGNKKKYSNKAIRQKAKASDVKKNYVKHTRKRHNATNNQFKHNLWIVIISHQ